MRRTQRKRRTARRQAARLNKRALARFAEMRADMNQQSNLDAAVSIVEKLPGFGACPGLARAAVSFLVGSDVGMARAAVEMTRDHLGDQLPESADGEKP